MKTNTKTGWWERVRQAVAEVDRNADDVTVKYVDADGQVLTSPLRLELARARRQYLFAVRVFDWFPRPNKQIDFLKAKLALIREFRESFIDLGFILCGGFPRPPRISLQDMVLWELDAAERDMDAADAERQLKEAAIPANLQVHEQLTACLQEAERIALRQLEAAEGFDPRVRQSIQKADNRAKDARNLYFQDLFDIWIEIGGNPRKKQQAERFMRAAAEPVLGKLGESVLRNWFPKAVVSDQPRPRLAL